MTYVLGTAANTGAPLRLQFTVQNDSLGTLASAYGVTAQQIWDMQPGGGGAGLRMERVPVQNFVKALPGWNRDDGIFAFVASDNPRTVGPNGQPEGYAHFTSHTQLMLPDMERLDGKKPRGALPPPSSKDDGVQEAGMGVGAILFGAAALALLAFGGKKKPSPKPVKF